MSSRMKSGLRVALGALAVLAFDGALASEASAQSTQQRAPRGPVVDLDGLDVDGRPHGPGTFYVVRRAEQEYGSPEVRTSFIPKIIESVERRPF